jgi:uncharacterized protein
MSPSRQALIVRGGWEGHAPVHATDLFRPFLAEQGFEVRVEDSPAVYADAATMGQIDVIVQCVTMSSIGPDELAGLRTAIEAGTGMAGWHGGIADSYRNSSDYLHLIGGQFACHPGKHPSEQAGPGDPANNYLPHRIEIRPDRRDHPIVAGLDDFDLVTEQYWVLADDYIDVLATTTLAARPWDPWHRPVTSPAVWTRQWGRGRIFVATPGHSLDVLEHPVVRTIIERGILWAGR